MGEPPPSFSWLHNGQSVNAPHYRHFYADYGATLQVHVRNESQLGDYKCKVSNSLGNLERVIKLRRGQKPAAPSRFQLKRLFTDGFELDIRSVKHANTEENMHTFGYRVEFMSDQDFKYSGGNWSYAKRRDFTFSRGKFFCCWLLMVAGWGGNPLNVSFCWPFPITAGGRFVITNLQRNTTYLMRAATRNLAGLSDWSNVKFFATLSNLANRSLSSFNWKSCSLAFLLVWWLMARKGPLAF